MAAPLTPEQLISALKKFGVPYKLYPGWKTRTRPGSITPIGFIIHHTGGAFTESDSYLRFLFETGRPAEGIPGPLCNFSIGPSGTVHVGSLGRANHAGRGSWRTRQLVGAESYDGYKSEISPGPDDYGTANGLFWGVEINYPGSVPMRSAQYESVVKLTAALMDAWGWSALSTIGHREHSRRKVDPGKTSMATFRRDVRDLLRSGGADLATPKENWKYRGFDYVNEDATTKDHQVAKTHQYAWEIRRGQLVIFGQDHWTVREGVMAEAKYRITTALRNIWGHVKYNHLALNEQKKQMDELRQLAVANKALLETLVDRDPSTPLTAEQVRAVVDQALLESDGRVVNVRVEVDPSEDVDDVEIVTQEA